MHGWAPSGTAVGFMWKPGAQRARRDREKGMGEAEGLMSRKPGQSFTRGNNCQLCFRQSTLVLCALDRRGKARGWGQGKRLIQVQPCGRGKRLQEAKVMGTRISHCIQERERVGAKGSGVNRYKQRCKLEEREGWEWECGGQHH